MPSEARMPWRLVAWRSVGLLRWGGAHIVGGEGWADAAYLGVIDCGHGLCSSIYKRRVMRLC